MSTEEAKPGLQLLDIDDEANGILAYRIDGPVTQEDAQVVSHRGML